MESIICVDLTKLDTQQLEIFCNEYDFLHSAILDFKEKTYAKLWITKEAKCIAFTLTRKNIFDIEDFDVIRVFDGFLDDLSLMESYMVPVEPVIFDIDTILEKIFKYGKESLTSEEKKFLDET
jgi:hypothetical protein